MEELNDLLRRFEKGMLAWGELMPRIARIGNRNSPEAILKQLPPHISGAFCKWILEVPIEKGPPIGGDIGEEALDDVIVEFKKLCT